MPTDVLWAVGAIRSPAAHSNAEPSRHTTPRGIAMAASAYTTTVEFGIRTTWPDGHSEVHVEGSR